MNKRVFGKTGIMVSEIGLGTWQLGGKWGEDFNEENAQTILGASNDAGINFIDTADVYNNGESEKAIAKFLKDKDGYYVVTKAGRQLNPHTAEQYTIEHIEQFVDDSRIRLEMDTLDMVLLHCPPSEVYENKALFEGLEGLKDKGKIKGYGVSIEKVSEGLKAMEYGIDCIEVIFNMFRLKPLDQLFKVAKEHNIAIIVRVPLASGLLTGKYTMDTKFGENDHRTFNRNGEAFDKGETFSGVDYATGLKAVDELKALFGTDDLSALALRFILMYDAVSCVIPGASNVSHVHANIAAATLPPLTPEQMDAVEHIYNTYIKESVEDLW